MEEKGIYFVDLGWCIGKLQKPTTRGVELTIVSPADNDGDEFVPAQSISIFGEENIMRLKRLLEDWEKRK